MAHVPVTMRSDTDCVVCSVATITNKSYEEVDKLFPRRLEKINNFERGISDGELSLALLKLGYSATWLPGEVRDTRAITTYIDLEKEIIDRKCLLVVRLPSRHMCAYYDNKVYDPRFSDSKKFFEYFVEGAFVIK